MKVNRAEGVRSEEKLVSYNFDHSYTACIATVPSIDPTIACSYAAIRDTSRGWHIAKLVTQDHTLSNVATYRHVVAETRVASYLIHGDIVITREGNGLLELAVMTKP